MNPAGRAQKQAYARASGAAGGRRSKQESPERQHGIAHGCSSCECRGDGRDGGGSDEQLGNSGGAKQQSDRCAGEERRDREREDCENGHVSFAIKTSQELSWACMPAASQFCQASTKRPSLMRQMDMPENESVFSESRWVQSTCHRSDTMS